MQPCVLITGASGGIGAKIAEYFSNAGYRVGIHYCHNKEGAEQLKAKLLKNGGDAEIFCADLSDSKACVFLRDRFKERFGPIDVLINNAGISKIAPINDVSFEDWNRLLSLNLSSPFYLIKSFLPDFLCKKSGSIINISSMWGVSGASCEVAYSASKAGLIGLTKALAKELGPSGIRVNAISPGVINTKMNEALGDEILKELQSDASLQRLGTPSDIAAAALFLADNEKAGFITGQNLVVDGGFI